MSLKLIHCASFFFVYLLLSFQWRCISHSCPPWNSWRHWCLCHVWWRHWWKVPATKSLCPSTRLRDSQRIKAACQVRCPSWCCSSLIKGTRPHKLGFFPTQRNDLSFQFKVVSMRSEKPILCAPPSLWEVSRTLPLRQFQCSFDWRRPSLVFSRKIV